MHIGLVGLGRMGGNMRDRLRAAGVEVTGYDTNPGISDVATIGDLVVGLGESPRVVWVMVPAGAVTESVVTEVASHMGAGDVIVDGGNSLFKDDIRRAEHVADAGVRRAASGGAA
jgi:6-phosphogluconate dehydrogenase